MPMINWVITNYVDPNLNPDETWVYYLSPNFRGIHFSRNVDHPDRDHMATNDHAWYYFGVTRTFNNPAVPMEMQHILISAWNDYFTVLPR